MVAAPPASHAASWPKDAVVPTLHMNPLDWSFLATESESTLTHVGGLVVYRAPDSGFGERLTEAYRGYATPAAPFHKKPNTGLLGRVVPHWDVVDRIDAEQHVRYHRTAGGRDALRELVSRLHGERMDRAKPMWEIHVIDGAGDGRVAAFMKVHHSLADGVSLVKLAGRTMADRPQRSFLAPMWAQARRRATGAKPAARGGGMLDAVRAQVTSPVSLLAAINRVYLPGFAEKALVKPFSAPNSILNGAITSERGVVTCSVALPRAQALAGRAGGTVNDVVLAVCAGALREYLGELGKLPDTPLVAAMPISFQPSDSDGTGGNALSFGLATLATEIADPAARYRAIVASTAAAKRHMSRLPRSAILPYTTLFMAPVTTAAVTGLGDRVPPMFNVVISNVPGPQADLFHHGARLEEWYPASIPMAGQALNITVLSYAGRLHFGFTACPAALPDPGRLAPAAAAAMTALERAL